MTTTMQSSSQRGLKFAPGALCVVCLALAMGCGGSKGAEGAKAGPVEDVGAKAQEDAAKRFAAIAEEIEKLGKDDTLDAVHLEQRLSDIAALDPNHAAARFNLAVLKERRGDVAAARQLYEEVRRRDPNFIAAAENLAAFYVTEGKRDVAMEIYRAAVKRDPRNVTSRLAMARILAEERDYEEAITLARQVLQRKADAIEAFRVLARSYKAMGNVPMAELIIGRGLKVDENDVELHQLTAQILLERNKLAEGVNKLKQLVTMAPKRLQVRAELAEIALKYRDFGNAAQQFDAILKMVPEHREARIGLAVSFKGLGRFDEAQKLYKTMLTQTPNDPDALWNLGVLQHRHLNQYDEAVASFQAYRRAVDPGDDKAGAVDALVKDIQRQKNDIAALKEREERERKRLAALEAACTAVSEKRPPDLDALGGEQERIEVAWQLLLMARDFVEGGDAGNADYHSTCAFAVLPSSQRANLEACAPMHVVWTQELYRMGRLEEAVKSTSAALACDPENPDALLIKEQLMEILAAQAAESAAAPEGAGMPATEGR